MIVPKRDAKCYGAVHIDNYLTFTGFCKKVDSDEVCRVDVFIDGNKIDAIKADKNIQKIEQIYDIDGHGFEYNLCDEYFEESHLLEFKSYTGEELMNSKIKTIDKKNPKFNEYSFFNSLDRYRYSDLDINEDNYNKIGFLAIEDSLKDEKFISFIKLLKEKFVELKIVAYYFSVIQKQKVIELFGGDTICIIPKNIDDISKNCSVYLHSELHRENPILAYYSIKNILRDKSNNTFVLELNKSVDTLVNLFDNISLTVNKKLDLQKSFVIELLPEDIVNEYRFLNSLKLPIDEEKIKDVYCPNSIGFLATEENLEDEEFVEYINQIMNDFPNCTFKALVFNDNLNHKIKNLFTSKNLEIIKISSIYEVFENIEIYLSNYERTFNDKYEMGIIQFIRKYSTDLMDRGLGLQRKNISAYQLEINNPNYFQKFFDNLEYLGFDNNDISKYGKTYHEIYFKKACEKYGVDIEFDMNETVSKAYVYWYLKLGLANHEFFRYALEFGRKFAKLQ